MIKLLYPEVKPHHWIGLSILVGICACMRDWGASEVSQSIEPFTTALVYGGLKAAGGAANWIANRKQTKDQRDAYAKGMGMLQKGYKPPGLSQAGKEGIRAAGTQQLHAATRGIEAETRRGTQGKVGGSELATQAILAKQKAGDVPKIAASVTAADEAAKKGQYDRWASQVSGLTRGGPAPVTGSPIGEIVGGATTGMDVLAKLKKAEADKAFKAAYLKSITKDPKDPPPVTITETPTSVMWAKDAEPKK
jgi:hypothetical protein